MLSNSEVEYLTTQEAKVYATEETIVAMVALKDGVAKNDMQEILRVISDKKVNLLADPLIS
jgi:hypothetical protein